MTSRQVFASFKTQFARANGVQISSRGSISTANSLSSYAAPLLSGNVSATISNAVASGKGNNSSLTFVRYATKKAAGSKTSNKDSAGRRLGLKVSDGEEIQTGQIIYRQRGTKIYPGENVGIGKDHTLFALEKGWVRYYLDPFHPKRKFVGIVLKKGDRLPSPHFAPTARRFGREIIEDTDLATQELNHRSQKERRFLPEIESALEERISKREAKRSQLLAALKQVAPDACGSEAEFEVATDYLILVRKYLNAGRTSADAQYFSSREYKTDLTIDKNAGRITEDEYAAKLASFTPLVEKLNTTVMFGPKLNLIKYQSEEEIKADRLAKVKEIEEIYSQGPVVGDRRKKISQLIESDCFPVGYRCDLRRRYLKTLKPQHEHLEYLKEKGFDNLSTAEMLDLVKKKKGSILRKWNYDLRKVDSIFVPKH